MTTETNSPAFMLYRVDGNGPETRLGAHSVGYYAA